MSTISTCMGLFHVPPLLFLALLTSLTPSVFGIPGNYETYEIFKNRKLIDGNNSISGITSKEECENLCVRDATCDGYAVSLFFRECELYVLNPGTPSKVVNSFRLYIRTKTEEEGFYAFGKAYVQIIASERLIFDDAKAYCAKSKGSLVTVQSEDMNNLLVRLMTSHSVWSAFIGLTDEETEDEWKYMDGSVPIYTNWNEDGKWPRKDKNCAVITINGKWFHDNCNFLHYFFCEIPMF